MRIETICTGDELLTGLTADTNSPFFQEQLLHRTGQTVRRSVVVGDVEADIIEALDDAARRCDAVLVSGGMGPTTDDLTVAAAARAAGVALDEAPEVVAHIERRAKDRGLQLAPNFRLQARCPRGAEVVLNAEGSAPLLVQRRGGCTFFFVPGVPSEYRFLVETQVVPRLAALAGSGTTRLLRVLKTIGIPEGQLDARITPLASRHPRVTFGYRTQAPENHLKLLAEAPTADEARAALTAAEADARAALGTLVFGADDDTLPSVVLSLLRQAKGRLALAESCTGGLIASLLTDVPGASDVLWGGAVTYTEAAKTRFAQVPVEVLAAHTAVSPQTAEAMARGVRAEAGVDFGLSVTGYAGPGGGTPEDPVGTVYLGLSSPAGTRAERHRFHGSRDRVRRFAAATALDLLRKALVDEARAARVPAP